MNCIHVIYVHRYDINQSVLRSKIKQSVSGTNNTYDIEQSRYSEVKQPAASGNNTFTGSTIRNESITPSEPEYEIITADSKPVDNVNNESWL